jgi:hypothetical protein
MVTRFASIPTNYWRIQMSLFDILINWQTSDSNEHIDGIYHASVPRFVRTDEYTSLANGGKAETSGSGNNCHIMD